MTEHNSSRKSSYYLLLGIIAAFVAVAVLYYAVALVSVEHAASVAFGPNAPPGPMTIVGDWPQPMQDLYRDLRQENDPEFDAYLLSGAPGIHSVDGAVFRIDVTQQALETVVSRLQLATVQKDNRWVVSFGRDVLQSASKDWWADNDSSNVTYYVSQPMLDGDEGDLYVAAHDGKSQKLFVYYWFNF